MSLSWLLGRKKTEDAENPEENPAPSSNLMTREEETYEEVHYDMPSSPGTVSTTEADQAPLVMTTNINKMRISVNYHHHRSDPLDAISVASSSSDASHLHQRRLIPVESDYQDLCSSDDEMDQQKEILTDVRKFLKNF